MKKPFDQTELEKLSPQIDPAVLKDFLDRMDPDYFLEFSTRTVAEHVTLANTLTLKDPCTLLV